MIGWEEEKRTEGKESIGKEGRRTTEDRRV